MCASHVSALSCQPALDPVFRRYSEPIFRGKPSWSFAETVLERDGLRLLLVNARSPEQNAVSVKIYLALVFRVHVGSPNEDGGPNHRDVQAAQQNQRPRMDTHALCGSGP